MRQGEILGLTWDNVDLDRGILSLKDTKSGYPRLVPLVDSVLKQFQQIYITRNPNVPFVFPVRGDLDHYASEKPGMRL
jgi:integrase